MGSHKVSVYYGNTNEVYALIENIPCIGIDKDKWGQLHIQGCRQESPVFDVNITLDVRSEEKHDCERVYYCIKTGIDAGVPLRVVIKEPWA
jgi:hypothetical protein